MDTDEYLICALHLMALVHPVISNCLIMIIIKICFFHEKKKIFQDEKENSRNIKYSTEPDLCLKLSACMLAVY